MFAGSFLILLTRIAQDVWLSKSTDPGDMIQVAEKIDDVKIRPKGQWTIICQVIQSDLPLYPQLEVA